MADPWKNAKLGKDAQQAGWSKVGGGLLHTAPGQRDDGWTPEGTQWSDVTDYGPGKKGSQQNPDGTWTSGTWSGGGYGAVPVFTPDKPAATGAGGQTGALLTPGFGEQSFGYYVGQGAWDPNKNLGAQAAPGAVSAIQSAQGQNAAGYNMAHAMYNAPSRADEAYNNANLAVDPNLGGFYDNAKKRAGESIGDALASRGLTGSSFEQNRLANSYTDLEAERANREADYGLNRARTLGSLGSAADSSRHGFMSGGLSGLNQTAQTDIAGTNTAMGILGNVDQQNLDTVNSGMTAGLGAQGAMTDRIRGGIADVSGAWLMANNVAQETFKNMFGTDMSMEDAINAVGPEKVRAAIEGDKAARDEIIAAAGVGVNAAGLFGDDDKDK